MENSPAELSAIQQQISESIQRRLRWWHVPLWCTKWGLRLLLLAWFVLGVGFLVLRHYVAPQIAEHRSEIAQALGERLGLRVEIAALNAQWDGLRPRLDIRELRIFDSQGREALALPAVQAEVAWRSLVHRRLELHELRIEGADLAIRRDTGGQFFVAGLPIERNADQQRSGFADFVLSQHSIVIAGARLSWADERRGAPPLQLEGVALKLENDDERHSFALAATPPAGHAGPLDLRADLYGEDIADPADWRGKVYLDLQDADLAIWRRWVDYPVELPAGRGSVRAWLDFAGTRIGAITADVALTDVQLRLAENLPMLDLTRLQGRVKLAARDGDFTLSGERLSLHGRDGLDIAPTNFSVSTRRARDKRPAGGELIAAKLDMQVLQRIAAHLPLPRAWQARLAQFAPRGWIERLQTNWTGEGDDLQGLRISTRFRDVAVAAHEQLPGAEGLSGELEGDERGGRYQFEVRDGSVDLPRAFRESHIPLTRAQLSGTWGRDKTAWVVTLASAKFANADAEGEAHGSWRGAAGDAGHIDLHGSATRASPMAVWRYIPSTVGQNVPDWLQHGLVAGHVDQVKLRLRGNLDDFPFQDGKGEFRVAGRIHEGRLDHTAGWPVLENIDGEFLFERERMLISARSARYRGVTLSNVSAEIPDLAHAHEQLLRIQGHARGPTRDFITYVATSPLAARAGSFINEVNADGEGELDLRLDIPLHDTQQTTLNGDFRMQRNLLRLTPGLPDFTDANARLLFTERGISIPQISAGFIGGRLTATGVNEADGSLRIDMRGNLPAAGLARLVEIPVWRRLSGEAQVSATLRAQRRHAELRIVSNLQGLGSSLPAPFAKNARDPLPLSITWRSDGGDAEARAGQQAWRLQLGRVLDAEWFQQCAQACSFTRGMIGVNEEVTLPPRGLRVAVRLDQLDIDAWRDMLPASGGGAESEGAGMLESLTLRAGSVLLAGHQFRNVAARASHENAHWLLRLEGPDAAGELSWVGEGDGRLLARMQRLSLVSASQPAGSPVPATSTARDEHLPALDIQAEQFTLYGLALGSLDLFANPRNGDWQLDRIAIGNESGSLEGKGSFRRIDGVPETQLEFRVVSRDAGGLLGRLGHPGAIRRGEAELSGKLRWRGLPTRINYATLNGNMLLAARDGQFVKLDPGAGRLLGVLSLQALPRRITLDFRDVFSEGFAFDTIVGNLDIEAGVLHTKELAIRGPAAKVALSGSTDLGREQHDLRVNVQPTLSESVAVGAAAVAAVNPVVGLAAYLAQKVLRDPVEKLFAYDYAITGPWADPRVSKIAGAQSAPSRR